MSEYVTSPMTPLEPFRGQLTEREEPAPQMVAIDRGAVEAAILENAKMACPAERGAVRWERYLAVRPFRSPLAQWMILYQCPHSPWNAWPPEARAIRLPVPGHDYFSRGMRRVGVEYLADRFLEALNGRGGELTAIGEVFGWGERDPRPPAGFRFRWAGVRRAGGGG